MAETSQDLPAHYISRKSRSAEVSAEICGKLQGQTRTSRNGACHGNALSERYALYLSGAGNRHDQLPFRKARIQGYYGNARIRTHQEDLPDSHALCAQSHEQARERPCAYSHAVERSNQCGIFFGRALDESQSKLH